MPSGVPLASTTRWRFVPRPCPRSVGFGARREPLFCGQAGAVESSRDHRVRPRPEAAPASRGGARPRRRLPAMRPADAARLPLQPISAARQVLPLHAGAQDQENAGQRRPVRGTRAATFRLLRSGGRSGLDHRPEDVRYESVHALSTRPSQFLSHALRVKASASSFIPQRPDPPAVPTRSGTALEQRHPTVQISSAA